jgi:uncharacterized protein involved in outer membrane biogenesis
MLKDRGSAGTDRSTRSRNRRIVVWFGAVLVIPVLVCGLLLSISDWNFARSSVASYVAGKLHRAVRIDGNLTAHLLSKHPRVRIEGIVVRNPEWVGDRELATIESVEFSVSLRDLIRGDLVLESLHLQEPTVALIGDKTGRANYRFATVDGRRIQARERELPAWPAVQLFTLVGGELYVRDELHKLTFHGVVEATESTDRDTGQFKVVGEGDLNGEAFEMRFAGGPLVNLRMDERYEFETEIAAGQTRVVGSGEFAKPFDFATLSASVKVKGENLAHLYYLSGLALPFTPPYQATADLISSKQKIRIDNLKGTIGKSDISGTAAIDLANDRPKLIAKLQSMSLDLADLAPAVGKGIRTDVKSGGAIDSQAPEDLPPDKVFPTYRFQFDRLRSTDADVTLHADSVRTQRMPFTEVSFHLKLDESILVVDPLVFTLPQGKIAATIHIDARDRVAKNKIDVRLHDVQLDQFKGKKSKEPPFEGTLQARMQIAGSGNSVHDMASNADGKLNAVVPHGEVRKAFAELAGINVARGLGLLLAKNQSRMPIRCGIATIDIHDGSADVDQMVFDTETVLIKGGGIIALEPERLDLDIAGHPKKFQLVRLRAPITVNGSLRKPSIGVDAGDTAKQIGIAAAIGALVTPLTSALAFIDPGLAKDANCAALLSEAAQAQATKELPLVDPVAFQTNIFPANNALVTPAASPLPEGRKF